MIIILCILSSALPFPTPYHFIDSLPCTVTDCNRSESIESAAFMSSAVRFSNSLKCLSQHHYDSY